MNSALARIDEIRCVVNAVGNPAAPSEVSHLLVHAIPHPATFTAMTYQFASRFVTRRVLELSRQANIMNVKSFILVSGANGGSLRGQCFEDLAHTFVAKGLLTSIRALSEEGRPVLPKFSATHAFLLSSEHPE